MSHGRQRRQFRSGLACGEDCIRSEFVGGNVTDFRGDFSDGFGDLDGRDGFVGAINPTDIFCGGRSFGRQFKLRLGLPPRRGRFRLGMAVRVVRTWWHNRMMYLCLPQSQ